MMTLFFRCVTEFIGTFVFLSVIILTGDAIPIAITLGAMLYFTAKISDGHLNPAVSIMLYAKGNIDTLTLCGYILSQVLAGICALLWYNKAYSKIK